MTIFHVLKYPVADHYNSIDRLEGAREVKEAFPELYEEWLETSWRKRLNKNECDVSESVNVLRKMLLEYEEPDDTL